MDTNSLIAAFLGIMGGLVTTLAGLFFANKAGVGITQEKLVARLKDLVDIQEKKIGEQADQIKDLETRATNQDTEIASLKVKIDDLSDLTVRQAQTIDKLSRAARNLRERGEHTNEET